MDYFIYMIGTSAMKELIKLQYLYSDNLKDQFSNTILSEWFQTDVYDNKHYVTHCFLWKDHTACDITT